MNKDQMRNRRLLIHCMKQIDSAFENYKAYEVHKKSEGAKYLLTKDLADIACCLLFIAGSEHLDLENEIYAILKRKTKKEVTE